MRAGSLVEALAQRYRVHLLVVPLQDPSGRSLNPEIAAWCEQHAVLRPPRLPRFTRPILPRPPEWRSLPAAFLKRATRAFPGVAFSHVHVFRLCAAPIGLHFLRGGPPGMKGVLDLDELESSTRRSLAERYRENGMLREFERSQQEADAYEVLEDYYVPSFDQVVLCSDHEAELLLPRRGARSVAVIPNAVRIPEEPPPPGHGDPHTLLFVGNPNHFPNRDGLEYLSGEILPILRSLVPEFQRVDVVGFRRPTCAAGRSSGLRFLGSVASVGPHYDGAGAVVVPIRVGGGTRIKILEAFGRCTPVVSTSKGAEGLAVESGRHLLLADDARGFAECCARVIRDRQLAAALAREAFDLVSRRYSQAVVDRLVAADLFAPA
jgi:glycosyltransferase involved in cell wall biosynthesis